MIFYSKEILSIWLKITENSEIFMPILQVLVIGVMFNSLCNLPVNLHFAAGITKIMVFANIVWIGVLPVMMWRLTSAIGLLGAPLCWLLYNLFCLIVVSYSGHKKLLKESSFRFFIHDIGGPLTAACLIIGLFYLLVPMPSGAIGQLLVIGVSILFGETGAMMTINRIRSGFIQLTGARFLRHDAK